MTACIACPYAVTLLDFGLRAPITAFSGRGLIAFAGRRSRRKGIITSRQMGSAFTWLRPDDLVFNYWVNNYLMGDKPPAFDILAWNADGTNLPGALHGQFLDIFRDNLLTLPGRLRVLGTPLRLRGITIPTFVTGAVTDHLTHGRGCYQTTQLFGGPSTFVLSYFPATSPAGNPPGNPKAHYWTGSTPGADPDQWLADAEKQQGSWWEPWADWVTARADNASTNRTPSAANDTRSCAPRPGSMYGTRSLHDPYDRGPVRPDRRAVDTKRGLPRRWASQDVSFYYIGASASIPLSQRSGLEFPDNAPVSHAGLTMTVFAVEPCKSSHTLNLLVSWAATRVPSSADRPPVAGLGGSCRDAEARAMTLTALPRELSRPSVSCTQRSRSPAGSEIVS